MAMAASSPSVMLDRNEWDIYKVAEYLHCSHSAIRRWVKDEKLKPFPRRGIKDKLIFKAEDIIAFTPPSGK